MAATGSHVRNVGGSACKAGAVHRWGTDLTSVMTGEGQAAVFVAVDHCSAECLGIHASRDANRFEALEPVRQAVRRCHGAFGREVAAGLRLRHDHGSQYVSRDFQKELRFLGIESSPAFVREPEGPVSSADIPPGDRCAMAAPSGSSAP